MLENEKNTNENEEEEICFIFKDECICKIAPICGIKCDACPRPVMTGYWE